MQSPDFLAIMLCLFSVGGGYYINTINQRAAKIIGISAMALGGAGLLFWFIYLRGVVEEAPPAPSRCSNSVVGSNSGPMTNNCN
jgi:hypothetical protein